MGSSTMSARETDSLDRFVNGAASPHRLSCLSSSDRPSVEFPHVEQTWSSLRHAVLVCLHRLLRPQNERPHVAQTCALSSIDGGAVDAQVVNVVVNV